MHNILDIPFDESQFSSIAYDYSPHQCHGKVVNATFVPGLSGSAIHFLGNGYSLSRNVPLELDKDFTVMFWMRQFKAGDFTTPSVIKYQFAWADETIREYFSSPLPLNEWKHIAMVKTDNKADCYIDGVKVGEVTFIAGVPVEWAIQQHIDGGDGFDYTLTMTFGANAAPYATADIDDYLIVPKALTPTDIKKIMHPEFHDFYIIDGENFKDYDVYVEGSTGLVDALELKEPTKVSWANEHGEIVDLKRPRFLPREIELDCWIKGANMLEWTIKQTNFLRKFQTAGLHRLECRINDKRPLLFTCYMAEGTKIEKKWKNGEFFGRFKLTLIDPQPVRRILRFSKLNNPNLNSTQTMTAKIRFSCYAPVNIYWGDGAVTNDVLANDDIIVEHTYQPTEEPFEIMITGEPDLMTNFNSNCILVWNRL